MAFKRPFKSFLKVFEGPELNVSRQTINSIENGKFDPSLPLAMRIAKFFDCKIEDIFKDKES